MALERFCTNFGYEPMAFDAVDEHGTQIYHTNVLMCVGTKFALIGLDRIVSPARQREVAERLTARGRTLIELTPRADPQLRGQRHRVGGARRPGARAVPPGAARA